MAQAVDNVTNLQNQGRVLIATDDSSDASMIRKLLQAEFSGIAVSTAADAAAKDFEKIKPAVLLLAFNTLEKAQHYYLGLHRFCESIHSISHRTLILCRKEDLDSVYELCKKDFFDDYILFWPLSQDGKRLPMSVHVAFRALKGQAAAPSLSAFVAEARQMSGFEGVLSTGLQEGTKQLAHVGEGLERTKARIYGAFDDFARQIVEASGTPANDPESLQRELRRFRVEELAPIFQAAADSAQPAKQWLDDLGDKLQPHVATMTRFKTLAAEIRPLVLIVEDDEFQLKMLAGLLDGPRCEVDVARSGAEAMNRIGKRRPDLIFLDLDLPEMKGIDVLRRLQASPTTASIPVVVVSGHSERQKVVESLGAGARGFIVKPFDRALIIRKMQEFFPEPKANPAVSSTNT